MTLKTPYLVVDKKRKYEETDETNENCAPLSTSSLEIIGIVRKKILFKTRPKPRSHALEK